MAKIAVVMGYVWLVACTTTPPNSRTIAVKKENTCILKSHTLEREWVVEKVLLGLDRGQPQLVKPFTACTIVIGPPRSEAEGEYAQEKAVNALVTHLSHYQWDPPFYGEGDQFFLISQKPYVELVFSKLPGKGWFLTGVAAKDLTLRRKLYGMKLSQTP